MSIAVAPDTWDHSKAARTTLRRSAIAWFVPTLIGQWLFAYHIASTYFGAAFTGDITAWNKRLFVGIVAGDAVGNSALVAHLFIAFFVSVAGPLQLIPQIRDRWPTFHRWNGRIYIAVGFVTSLAALYMIWTRKTFGGMLVNDISVSLDALLIMVFSAIALRHAMARRISVHQRWALRTFIVMSGVWFTRIIYATIDRVVPELRGFTDDMTGPTNITIGFASYLLPLAILELYLLGKRSTNPDDKFAAAAIVLIAAILTTIGVYGRAGRWLTM